MSLNDNSRSPAERTEASKDSGREISSGHLGGAMFSSQERKFWHDLFVNHGPVKIHEPAGVAAGERTPSPLAMAKPGDNKHQFHLPHLPSGDKSPAVGHGGRQYELAGKLQHPDHTAHNKYAPKLSANDKHGRHGGSGRGGFGGTMSFYDEPQQMANGHRFNPEAYTVASKTLPLGSVVDIHSHGKTIRATVTDRGPYYGDRSLDVSKRIAREFGFTRAGTAQYTMDVVSSPSGHHHRHYQA